MYRGDGKVEMNDLVQLRPGNGACDLKQEESNVQILRSKWENPILHA